MKNIIIGMSTIFLIVLFYSCRKQLHVLPTTSRVDGNAITDAKSARTVLNGVYYRFANAGVDNNRVPITQWYLVQQTLPSRLSGLLVNPQGDDLSTHNYTSQSNYIGYMWTWGYAIVNAANGFLKNIEDVSMAAAEKAQMRAEAKFLRAFANSTLLLYFGEYADVSSKYGIILRDNFVGTDDINLPRSGVADVYASAIADLDAAIVDLPQLNSTIYYANRSAAKLMKARLLINRGTAADYSEVVRLTTEVIADAKFSLEQEVDDLFLSKGLNSPEVILGIEPYPAQAHVFRNYQFYYNSIVSNSLVALLDGDPRTNWIYKTATTRFYGDVNTFTKYFTGDVKNPAPDITSELGYAFRLTEAYLLKAEALTLLQQDMPLAKALLKEIMVHAGITDLSSIDAAANYEELHLLIVKETMKNFVGEGGQDWLALRRLPFKTLKQLVPTLTNPVKLILPIPQVEINENIKMIQNPGY